MQCCLMLLNLQVSRENHTEPSRMTQHTSYKSSSWGNFPVGDSTMTSLVSTMNYCAQNKVSCLSFRGSLSYSQACIKDVNKWCLKEWISLKKRKLFFGTPWEMSHNAFTIAFTSTLLQVLMQVGHKMPMKSPYSQYGVSKYTCASSHRPI